MTAITTFADGLRDRAYNAVVYWILLAGLIGLLAVIAYDYGFLSYLYRADSSRISMVITALFLGFSLYCLYVIVSFSNELRVATEVSGRLRRGEEARIAGEEVWIGDMRLPSRRLVTEHILDLLLKRSKDTEAPQGVLLDSLISQLRSRVRFGSYASDVLYRLGMLGTVIGFILMLGTMESMGDITTESLTTALQSMTAGMATALLTTIAGLVGGLLLRLEFNLAEAVAADVVKKVVRIGDIHLAPATRPATHVRA